MPIPLEWKASIFGAEDVKAKLAEIRTEYQNGGIGIQEYTQKQTYLTRQLRQSNQSLGMQKSVFLATHPALNKLSQAMSIYGGVSRSVLSIMNAINLASIATHQFDQQIFDLNLQKLDQEKKIRQLKDQGREGTAEYDEEIAKLKEIVAQIKAIQEESKKQDLSNFVTNLTAIGTAVAVSTSAIISILPHMTKLRGALTALTAVSWTAAGPWGALAAAIIAVGVASYYLGNALWGDNKIGEAFAAIDLWWYTSGQATLDSIADYFTVTIPTAINASWVAFTGLFKNLGPLIKTAVNGIVGFLQVLINGFIAVINGFISAYNAIATKLGKSPIKKLDPINLSSVGGGSVSSGVETVPFAGSAFSKSAGGAVVTIIVNGSILAEREVAKIADEALKQNLKRVGFG